MLHHACRALGGAHAPANALAALGLLLDAAGTLEGSGMDAWPSAMPLVRKLALQAGEHYLGACQGAACHRASRLDCACGCIERMPGSTSLESFCGHGCLYWLCLRRTGAVDKLGALLVCRL